MDFIESKPTPRKINFSNGKIAVAFTRIHCAEALFAPNPGLWCAQNSDLFISPDGSIKPCLEEDFEIDILAEIQSRNEKALWLKLNLALNLLGRKCGYTYHEKV